MMIKFTFTLLSLLICSFSFAQTVVDIVVGSDDHTTLEAAVIAAELAGTLSGDGPFTVFAPTDDAFAALPAGTVDELLQDPTGDLARILLYHVLGGEVLSTDLSDGLLANTLLGQGIEVTINMDGVFINDAQVTVANIDATNGVVHVLDAVLLPPASTVVDVVVNSPAHNTLETAVIEAGLAGALSNPDANFTVFAPTDAAFDALPAGVLDELLTDPTGDLANILMYHVVGAEVLSSDLSDGQMATTLLGQDITVGLSSGVFINGAQVTVADIRTLNGVVHVIDAVILTPASTVVDVVVNSDVHTTLEDAVIAADLAGTLSGDGPFTVFAPTDAAFDLLPAGTVDQLLLDPTGDLTSILLYHVLGAEVLSSDLSDGQMAATLFNNQEINVTIDANGVFINNAQVIVADIKTNNGVVHVIDAVLLPELSSVNDLDKLELTVSPNPANDQIYVELPIEMTGQDIRAELISMDGKIAKSWTLNNNSDLDLNEIIGGTYILLLTTEKQYARSTIMVK